ncbi:serine/threonine-protein kinase [Kribbella sp. NPDC003557]|uniref:serine/threonine-protein kinase n=1 Tax=Kribbella sp. NPDC003557 TaxID=3154449 RepID=UPI0033A5A880
MGVPTRLGRYVVRRRLGSGGFATVWLAQDEQLDAEVAIKVLADNWGHDDSVRRRFLEEGRFLRRVESEHVVQVHDVGELEDGRPFLVLTYADRGTLADRLKKEPLPLAGAVDVVVQVGRGLQALHRRGLLHRDVKPANVLFRSTDDGERAVLSDLGLGKSLDEVSRITMPGGTPSYVAPEQALGERLDQRADQYSLGAVAYAALTGRSPHQVDGLGAASRVKVAPPPSSLGFELPGQVDAAIVRALDPDRENRWPDVQAFTKQLVGALDETTRNFPLAGRETVTITPDDLDAKTALSDENQPTIVKPSDLSEADVETVAIGTTAGNSASAATAAGGDASRRSESDHGSAVGTSGSGSAGGASGDGSGRGASGDGSGGASWDRSAGDASGDGSGGGASGHGSGGGASVDRASGNGAAGDRAEDRAAEDRAGDRAAGDRAAGAAAGDRAPGSRAAGDRGAGERAAVEGGAADAETAAVATAEPAVPRKRRGRWVVAAVLALLLGGGAGYAGHWYLSGRKMIQVSEGQFSVRLPESWARSMAQSTWTAPGTTGTGPAFRVSRDANWSGRTPGVFIGVSKSKLAVPDGKQCDNAGTPFPHTVSERPVTDRLSGDCFGADIVLLQRVVDHGDGGSLLVQVVVPGSDSYRATEIADSVQYVP